MVSKPRIYGFNERDAGVLSSIAKGKGLTGTNRIDSEEFGYRYKHLRYVAKTGSVAITARDGDTPGEGTVTLHWRSPHSGDLEPIVDDLGNEVTAKVYSWVSVESGTNNWVYVGTDAFGTLWFENEDCGALYA